MCADAQVGSSEIPRHAPPTKLDAIKKLESMALNVEIAPFKRAFASGTLLVNYTSLRLSDVQRLRIPEVCEDSAHGTPIRSKRRDIMAFRGLVRSDAWAFLVRPTGSLL